MKKFILFLLFIASANCFADWSHINSLSVNYINDLYISGSVIYAASSNNGIYRSTDGGENWLVTNISGSAVLAKNFTLHGGTIYAGRETNNTPIGYVSNNNGITWSNLTGLSFFGVITFYSDNNNLFAGTENGPWITTNNGVSWNQRLNGLTSDPYNSAFVRVNNILLTTLKFGGSGVYKTANDGVLWENFGQGLPFLTDIEDMIIFNNKILIGTSGGIYERNTSEVTGINYISSEVPSQFSLHQNYPNPFNPVTVINFQFPVFSFVTFKVYNAQGKEVSVLVNGEMDPGTYEVEWNGSNFSSGVYYYQLQAGDYRETKKMILLK